MADGALLINRSCNVPLTPPTGSPPYIELYFSLLYVFRRSWPIIRAESLFDLESPLPSTALKPVESTPKSAKVFTKTFSIPVAL